MPSAGDTWEGRGGEKGEGGRGESDMLLYVAGRWGEEGGGRKEDGGMGEGRHYMWLTREWL